MPYGYYQFVRLATCVGFAWLAYSYSKQPLLVILCIGIALLFNPVIIVHFDRGKWQAIDLITAGGLILWIIIDLVTLNNGKSRKERKA